nr:hypothetical protein [Tanacetum cinerariifolium]GEV25441.1 hypothetical protein [Tanacetum cinerariifolium]
MSSNEASSKVTFTSILSDYEEPSDVEYPEYLAPFDEEVSVEDQPYVIADSPTALSPGYIANSDPEEDYEDGPVDYPANGGDDNDDDSSNDYKEEEALEEEEEHLALADSVIEPAVEYVPSCEETEPFETDESTATPPSPPIGCTTAKMFVRPQAPMPSLSEAEVERLLALHIPPLISLSPSSTEERLARCLAAPAIPLALYLPPPIPTSLPLPLPSPPLPPLPASLFIPPPVDRMGDIPEAELPPHNRLCLTAPTLRYKVGESSTAAARPTGGHRVDYRFIGTLDAKTSQRADEVGYGIRDVYVDPIEAVEEVPPMTLEGVNDRVTELAKVHEEDTQDIYAMIEDAQDIHTRLSQTVDVLIEDREFHHETVLLMEKEALVSREALTQSVGLSTTVHQELQAYRTHIHIQDHRIASQEALIVTLVAHVSFLQGQLSVALGQIHALQARDLTHADDLEGADSFMLSNHYNNMPPKRTSATARAVAVDTAAAPMAAVAVEQLIEARVFFLGKRDNFPDKIYYTKKALKNKRYR